MRQPFSSQGSGGVVLSGGCVTWQRSCPCGQGAVWLLARYGMVTALVQGLSAPPRVPAGLLVNVRVAQLGHATLTDGQRPPQGTCRGACPGYAWKMRCSMCRYVRRAGIAHIGTSAAIGKAGESRCSAARQAVLARALTQEHARMVRHSAAWPGRLSCPLGHGAGGAGGLARAEVSAAPDAPSQG